MGKMVLKKSWSKYLNNKDADVNAKARQVFEESLERWNDKLCGLTDNGEAVDLRWLVCSPPGRP